jgi:hypothetical protein
MLEIFHSFQIITARHQTANSVTNFSLSYNYYYSFIHVPLHPQQAKAYRYSNMSIYNIAVHMNQVVIKYTPLVYV